VPRRCSSVHHLVTVIDLKLLNGGRELFGSPSDQIRGQRAHDGANNRREDSHCLLTPTNDLACYGNPGEPRKSRRRSPGNIRAEATLPREWPPQPRNRSASIPPS